MGKHVFAKLPSIAAWRLIEAYEGHEVVRFTEKGGMIVLEGTTTGVEEGIPWSIWYVIKLNKDWHARHAIIDNLVGNHLEIEGDGQGSWLVNGNPQPELEGCLDLDFEASLVTNTAPVHRLRLAVGEQGESAAVYIRSRGLAVERLDQTYRRLPDQGKELRFEYNSPRFEYHDTLHFGADGLIVQYPGIGERVQLQEGAA